VANVLKIVQGTITLADLMDGTNFKVAEGGVSISTPPPDILLHSPDVGESSVVRSTEQDRFASIVLHVYGTTRDIVNNNVIKLRRACHEAILHNTEGYTAKVQLSEQKDGTTYGVLHCIKSGSVDDTSSFYEPANIANIVAKDVVLSLLLAPYGINTTQITLSNDLMSSPHCVEDTNGDGLADGWTKTASGFTATIDTTNWLAGGKSQKGVAAAADKIFAPDTVACNTSVAAYIWILVIDGTIDVILRNVTAATDVQTKSIDSTDSGGVSDKTAIDTAGSTWYRVSLSSSGLGGADNMTIRTTNTTSTGTWYCDLAYIQSGTTTIPDAWMSARNIDNRNDIQSTSAATENYLNYIDVWGVPGDAPALIRAEYTYTGSATMAYLGAYSDQSTTIYTSGAIVDQHEPVALIPHWIENNGADVTTGSSGVGSSVTQNYTTGMSARSAATVARCTIGGSGGTGSIIWLPTGIDAQRFARQPHQLLAMIKSDTVSSTTLAGWVTFAGISEFAKQNVTLAVDDTWELVDLGTVNLVDRSPDNVPTLGNLQLGVSIIATGTGSEIIDIDQFIFVPLSDNSIYAIAGNTVWYDGMQDAIIDSSTGNSSNNFIGNFGEVRAGNVSTRFVCVMDTTVLTESAATKMTILPRSRHLLGTI